MHSPKQFIFSHVNLPRVLAGISALITALCVAWLGDGSYQIYDFYINSSNKKPDYDATLWSLVGFVFFSITTAYLVFNYSKVRELEKVEKEGISTQALIFTASPILGGFIPKFKKESGLLTEFSMELKGKTVVFSGDLTTDIELLKRHEWRTSLQQVLRGLRLQFEHFKNLQYIYFITNGNDEGDFGKPIKGSFITIDGEQIELNHEDCLELITEFYVKRYNQHTKISCKRALDKNNIQSYYKTIDILIDEIEATQANTDEFYSVKVEKRNIFVDITCAQVPGSVGATLATLHNQAAIQYTESTDFGDYITEPKSNLYNVGIKTID